jgi:hypothetical protein
MPRIPRLASEPDLPGLRDDTVRQLTAVLSSLRIAAPAAHTAQLDAARLVSAITQLLRVITQLHTANLANTTATSANTAATIHNSAATAGAAAGGGSSGGFLGSLLGGITKILPFVSTGLSLLSLFRRPREPQLELTPFREPAPLSVEVAANLRRFDFGAEGTPRPIAPPPPAAPPPMQVTVNVNAIDSRSFMDHAPALAQAVREAMLHMHPINQVVRESF